MSRSAQMMIDKFWQVTLFKVLPQGVRPNFFTGLRLALIPVILYFLAVGYIASAFLAFIIAALADSIDGSLARIRHQETELGALLDPVADKLLIMLMSMFLAFYFFPELMLIVVIFNWLVIMIGFVVWMITRSKEVPMANFYGKLRMMIQVLAIFLIFVFLIWGFWLLAPVAAGLLLLAIVFDFAGFLKYMMGVWG